MAINSTNSWSREDDEEEEGCPRRLFEILKEKQEPFVLEIYLLERGLCIKKGIEFDLGCCSSKRNHKRSSSSVKKSSEGFSSFAKSLYTKIGVVKQKHSSRTRRGRKTDKDVVEGSRCSTASFPSLSKTWCGSDTDGDSVTSLSSNKTSHERILDLAMVQWRFGEESKQFRPDSVFEEIDLLTSIPAYNVRQNKEERPTRRKRSQKKVSEDSILSASLREMLEQARKESPMRLGSKSFSAYMNSMKALQQTRRLLFDSVREVTESQNNTKQERIIRREKGSIMCKNFSTWGKCSGSNISLKKLLRTDLVNSDNEELWRGCGELKREIVVKIENSLFDEITDEIIRDMID